MTTTYAELKAKVARDVRDPDAATFEADDVVDLITSGFVEVSRIAPRRFLETLTVTDGLLEYPLQDTEFGIETPEVEVVRVEVWDTSETPDRFRTRLRPAVLGFKDNSQNGWEVWGGTLYITNAHEAYLRAGTDVIKVKGYAPWIVPSADEDVITLSSELEQAVRDYARIAALERLTFDRDLFSQWQTRSNNTDVSPAGLMNALSQAQDAWRRKSRAISISKESPR